MAPHEAIVAQTGYPVHNSLLLAVAELGLIGAILLLVPVMVIIWGGMRRLRIQGENGDFARAVIAMLVGICFVGATGWGVLQQPVVQLLFFVLGLGLSRMVRSEDAGFPRADGLVVLPRRSAKFAAVGVASIGSRAK